LAEIENERTCSFPTGADLSTAKENVADCSALAARLLIVRRVESNFTQLGALLTHTLTPCAAILDVFATVRSIVLPFDANGIAYELSVWAAAMVRLMQNNNAILVFIIVFLFISA